MAQLLTQGEIDARSAAAQFGNVAYMQTHHPALFATEAHPKMSQRYSFTNTYDIVHALTEKDYIISSLDGGDTRFSKMLIRMRHKRYADEVNMRTDGGAPEIIIMDSHDGSKSLRLALGYIKFLCMNGCIAGDMLYNRTFIHSSRDLMAQVMLEVQDIGKYVESMNTAINEMRNYRTTIAERMHLADVATVERFGKDRDESFKLNMRPKMLMRRRREDTAEDLHTVVNVIQENSLRGGFQYCTDVTSNRGVMRRSRPVNNVDTNVRINTRLWNAAAELMAPKQAA